jgi:hypothetical protein
MNQFSSSCGNFAIIKPVEFDGIGFKPLEFDGIRIRNTIYKRPESMLDPVL